jgi:hypothetical protein
MRKPWLMNIGKAVRQERSSGDVGSLREVGVVYWQNRYASSVGEPLTPGLEYIRILPGNIGNSWFSCRVTGFA